MQVIQVWFRSEPLNASPNVLIYMFCRVIDRPQFYTAREVNLKKACQLEHSSH